MFKYAIVILALAVSAALAVNVQHVQQEKQQSAEASHVVAHRKHVPDSYVYVSEPSKDEGGMIGSGLSGLLTVIGLPKKALGAVAGFAFSKIKLIGVKNLLKIALAAGLITVLGAVAAVVAVSVAGLVSVLSGICASVFYFVGGSGDQGGQGVYSGQGIYSGQDVYGGHGDAAGGAYGSEMDSITNFVTGAFNQYETLQKA